MIKLCDIDCNRDRLIEMLRKAVQSANLNFLLGAGCSYPAISIISQAHNYFIHQLINQRDLMTIGNAVSYIDQITEESIPTLPVGTCVFSGIATPMPLKLKIVELPSHQKPDSHTLRFRDLVSPGSEDFHESQALHESYLSLPDDLDDIPF